MKKILAAFITAALVFGPIGASIFQDQTTHVDARGYKSGKRGFNYNNNFNKNNNGSFFQNKKQNSVKNNRSTMNTNKKGNFMSSRFMKGMMLGGLAGLIFGGFLGHMGILGSMLGLMINVLAIFIFITILGKIISLFKRKKKENINPWQN
ncbi:hypothetical protein ACFSMW_02475 [Virgibacillus halophilus]|uniref:hypothetical protein n=1 Tax=Tigheibacillus halophilus TaxID=361280 RepID=UPI0036422A21